MYKDANKYVELKIEKRSESHNFLESLDILDFKDDLSNK